MSTLKAVNYENLHKVIEDKRENPSQFSDCCTIDLLKYTYLHLTSSYGKLLMTYICSHRFPNIKHKKEIYRNSTPDSTGKCLNCGLQRVPWERWRSLKTQMSNADQEFLSVRHSYPGFQTLLSFKSLFPIYSAGLLQQSKSNTHKFFWHQPLHHQ